MEAIEVAQARKVKQEYLLNTTSDLFAVPLKISSIDNSAIDMDTMANTNGVFMKASKTIAIIIEAIVNEDTGDE